MPKASGDEDQSSAKIINASDVEALYNLADIEEYWKNINFMEVGSNLIPYMDPEQFEREVSEQKKYGNRTERIGFKNKYTFSGKYGANLFHIHFRIGLEIHCIMNSNDFRRVYTVTIYHNVTRQITHRDNPVSSQHALAFQIKHQTVFWGVSLTRKAPNISLRLPIRC